MSANRDALQLLLPIDLGGEHDLALDIDARGLDLAQTKAETLLAEVFPDSSALLLADWERVLGIISDPEDVFSSRRAVAVQKIRARGGLSIPYFLGLAQGLGYEVEIIEPVPFMAGWGAAGDEIFDPSVNSQWGLIIHNQPMYLFRAGESATGEPLSWWRPQTALESLFVELKPAHTYVYFSYL